jgi:hypothetical protein
VVMRSASTICQKDACTRAAVLRRVQDADRADAPPCWLASLVVSRPPPGMVWKFPRCRLRGETGGRPGLAADGRCSCAPVRRCSSARSFASVAFSPAGPFDTDGSRAGSMAGAPVPPWRLALLPLATPSWVWLLGASAGCSMLGDRRTFARSILE